MTHEAIAAANAGLPPPMREVLVLSEAERMTDAEIADLTGMAADAVRLTVLRAAAGLARALGCSPVKALEAYRDWPLARAPLTAEHVLHVAEGGRRR